MAATLDDVVTELQKVEVLLERLCKALGQEYSAPT
jgi:hypothetical protein